MRLIGLMFIITLAVAGIIYLALARVGFFTIVGGWMEKATKPFKEGDKVREKLKGDGK